jgi:hypothetical protein
MASWPSAASKYVAPPAASICFRQILMLIAMSSTRATRKPHCEKSSLFDGNVTDGDADEDEDEEGNEEKNDDAEGADTDKDEDAVGTDEDAAGDRDDDEDDDVEADKDNDKDEDEEEEEDEDEFDDERQAEDWGERNETSGTARVGVA